MMKVAPFSIPKPQLQTPFHQWLPLIRTTQKCTLKTTSSFSSNPPSTSLRCAVLGAGFAGLSVAWHLLFHSPKELKINVDIYDEVGIGGGASGVAGGLVHPYSPKVKLLWRGEECWREFLNLLNTAEAAAAAASSWALDGGPHGGQNTEGFIVRKKGILRPAVNEKFLDVMLQNAMSCLASCPVHTIDENAARELIPNLIAPLNKVFYMPEAVNINPQNYLKALFSASENLVKRMSSLGFQGKNITLHKKGVASLSEMGDEYDAVIVCLGAKVDVLAELAGLLPLRACRGIVSHLQLCDSMWMTLQFTQLCLFTLRVKWNSIWVAFAPLRNVIKCDDIICIWKRIKIQILYHALILIYKIITTITINLSHKISEEYYEYSPSILSDAWLAVQGPKSIHLGSTWEWGSRNYSSVVSSEEASGSLQQLLPKASKVYPPILNWTLTGAQAGVRAMPPLAPQGSFPLLGCIDDFIEDSLYCASKYWLIGGLGARGLLYHGWLGKLTAQAVLSRSEDVLPPELTSWKKINRK